ncbi:MAG TPA: 4Fe-4S ferredoxin [Elusimicrobia bacterium]|nr:4Fe-4S ferredoxin [Elusimicrobiota bacterium]HBT61565.1 4Fe-4S ferredoxin [Elusimicrobiota bacterium]
MKRKIIRIDESKCDGCGQCASACAEGAIKIVAGKAKLVSDTYCDGLGACIGECPQGALTIEEREAEVFDEAAVKKHLAAKRSAAAHGGCPSARMMDFGAGATGSSGPGPSTPSALSQWPIQLHLVSPSAPYFQGSQVVLAADCVAYALGNFHGTWLKGKRLAIACPKLDESQDVYVEKIRALIDESRIDTLTVMIMQVPCCGGLLALVKRAGESARRKVPVKCVVVGLRGDVLSESWI